MHLAFTGKTKEDEVKINTSIYLSHMYASCVHRKKTTTTKQTKKQQQN
jgi:hypothetical protein